MSDQATDRLGRVVGDWWQRLHPLSDSHRGNSATAARLRRAATPLEVIVVPAAMDLYERLEMAVGDRRPVTSMRPDAFADGVAIIAGVLAGLRPREASRTAVSFATVLGRTILGTRPGHGERPLYSPLRFSALMRADAPAERLRHLRRAAAVARHHRFDIAAFAADMLAWNDDTRRRWIFEYHQRFLAAPDDTGPAGREAAVR